MSNTKPIISPVLPWKIRLYNFVCNLALHLSSHGPNSTVKHRFINLFDLKSLPSKKPINGVKSCDILVDTSRNLWFRLYVPTNPDFHNHNIPTIVFFHGGGFSFSAANSNMYHGFCRRLSRALTAVVISVNYRLAPEYRCPAQYDDGFDVLKFIDENDCFEDFATVNRNRCILAGDSAGANLAHHVAVKASGHKFNRLNITGLISIQPFFGGEERTEIEIKLIKPPLLSVKITDWFWKAFLPDGSDRNHPAVNVFGPNDTTDITGLKLPPTIVFVGGLDLLRDWGERYYQGLKYRGIEAYFVEYPNAFHTFYFYPELPEYSCFIKELKEFLQKQ